MSWLDLLPANERRKIRQRLRSPEAYERLRQSVKGPEDLEREMRENESLADLRFETELRRLSFEKLKTSVQEGIAEQGMESIVEDPSALSLDAKTALEAGAFDVVIEEDEEGNDQVSLAPEGNVAEKVKLSKNVSDQFLSGLSSE